MNTLKGIIIGALAAVGVYAVGILVELTSCACQILSCDISGHDTLPWLWEDGRFKWFLIIFGTGGAIIGLMMDISDYKFNAEKQADYIPSASYSDMSTDDVIENLAKSIVHDEIVYEAKRNSSHFISMSIVHYLNYGVFPDSFSECTFKDGTKLSSSTINCLFQITSTLQEVLKDRVINNEYRNKIEGSIEYRRYTLIKLVFAGSNVDSVKIYYNKIKKPKYIYVSLSTNQSELQKVVINQLADNGISLNHEGKTDSNEDLWMAEVYTMWRNEN